MSKAQRNRARRQAKQQRRDQRRADWNAAGPEVHHLDLSTLGDAPAPEGPVPPVEGATLVLPMPSALAFDDAHGGTPAQVGMTDQEAAQWLADHGLGFRWQLPGETTGQGFLRSMGLG